MLKFFSYSVRILKWLLFAGIIGSVGGLLGSAFHYTLHFVTDLRAHNLWLIFLLPVGGILTVGLYRLFKLTENKGTNDLIYAVVDNKPLKHLIAPAIFIASSLTHLFGGSGGREGAALQLGGSVASSFAALGRFKDEDRSALILCGMSAVFSALFGTPIAAGVFCIEFLAVGRVFTSALLPCFVSSYIAVVISRYFGVFAEKAAVIDVEVNVSNVWRVAVLAVAVAILGILMCNLFRKLGILAAKVFPNKYIRILVGAGLIVLATVAVGSQKYNGAGMDMALLAISGKADWFDFVLKLCFTAVTLAAGFKGGEIVPTFCIGATFGCFIGSLLGLDCGFAAAVGLIGLFCSATNAPIASLILSVEMFGSHNLYIFALIVLICYAFSGRTSLYSAQDKSCKGLLYIA